MHPPLNIAIAGLGTVGCGTVEILQQKAELLEQRCGRRLNIIAVSARNPGKRRPVDLGTIPWISEPEQLAELPNVDIIVEVIGGSEGTARTLVENALSRGISVVTANKALIAHHGVRLAELAEKNNAVLAFEAAVAGGIPVIKALRDGLAANRFTRIAGILNGTCNYILTKMWQEKAAFEPVLKEAQELGYAEAEPSFDVDGIDTAHKIAILASLAFGSAPAIDKVHVEGIRHITLTDMEFAEQLGYRIKLLGLASFTEHGLEQRVHPCMVPLTSPLANVHDVYNAVTAEGDSVGTIFFEGRGAGAGPTASSIVADIMDIARGVAYKPFTLPVAQLGNFPHAPIDALRSSYYLRLRVTDQPGVLAEVTGIFKEHAISVRSFLQRSHRPGEPVQVVLTTHETTESAMRKALALIGQSAYVKESPYIMRIVNL